ncbi:MAG TPA: CPBP family intramembrane glutamic endopeptidase [Rubrobacteraceae bacterium]|nr:CPBP family intramembrane glutamic endopeptidase [Rubrobacteraceae bacterium]
MRATIRNRIRLNPLVAFFVLALSITWFFQLVGLLLAERNDLALSNEDNLLHLLDLLSLRLAPGEASAYLLFTLGAGPLAASLLVTWASGGGRGIAELWARIKKWRVDPRWYLIVSLLPVALALLSLTAGILFGGLRLDSYSPLLPAVYFVPFLLYMLVFTGLAEEPGWRGFALPHLQSRYSALKSSWILGVLWGVWHFPFIIYYNLAAGIPALALIPILAGLVLGIVGWTIVNTWLYNSTESVFLMIVLHGWYNTVNSYMVLPFQNALAQTLGGILPWALAIILLRIYGGENLAARPRPRAETARPLASASPPR